MKHLRLYENLQTEQEVADICKLYNITNWSINSEGLVDVDGNVILSYNRLNKLPLKFGTVTGNFYCYNNYLTSLEGSPKSVGGTFYCHNNLLNSLEGSPKHVGFSFYCNINNLTSFEGAPDFVGGNFDSYNNLIYNIWNLFYDYSKIELFNYYDIIRELEGKPAIVLSRLNQFLEDIGKPPVKNVTGYRIYETFKTIRKFPI